MKLPEISEEDTKLLESQLIGEESSETLILQRSASTEESDTPFPNLEEPETHIKNGSTVEDTPMSGEEQSREDAPREFTPTLEMSEDTDVSAEAINLLLEDVLTETELENVP